MIGACCTTLEWPTQLVTAVEALSAHPAARWVCQLLACQSLHPALCWTSLPCICQAAACSLFAISSSNSILLSRVHVPKPQALKCHLSFSTTTGSS